MPQVGVTSEGFVIVRKIPLTEVYPSSLRTFVMELETGIHVITKGVPLEVDNIPENEITVQVCHPASDWQIKHILESEEIEESHRLIQAAIAEYKTSQE